MAHLPKSGPRDGNDRSIEIADSQAISNNVGPKMAISPCSKHGVDGYTQKKSVGLKLEDM